MGWIGRFIWSSSPAFATQWLNPNEGKFIIYSLTGQGGTYGVSLGTCPRETTRFNVSEFRTTRTVSFEPIWPAQTALMEFILVTSLSPTCVTRSSTSNCSSLLAAVPSRMCSTLNPSAPRPFFTIIPNPPAFNKVLKFSHLVLVRKPFFNSDLWTALSSRALDSFEAPRSASWALTQLSFASCTQFNTNRDTGNPSDCICKN